MYTVDEITELLERKEFNIRTKDGLQRVKGYTCAITCFDDSMAHAVFAEIGVHKNDAGFWTITDLHSGCAITSTLVWKTRKEAIGAFLMKYPAYSRFCMNREFEEIKHNAEVRRI